MEPQYRITKWRQRIESFEELLQVVQPDMVFRVTSPAGVTIFTKVRLAFIQNYREGKGALHANAEISETGVHSTFPIMKHFFSHGYIVEVADSWDCKGKKFSYDNVGR